MVIFNHFVKVYMLFECLNKMRPKREREREKGPRVRDIIRRISQSREKAVSLSKINAFRSGREGSSRFG